MKKRLKEYNKCETTTLELSRCMIEMLEKYGLEGTDAYREAESIYDLGMKEKDAFDSNRFVGSIKLIRLYINDRRYRKCGTNAFIYQLAGIISR